MLCLTIFPVCFLTPRAYIKRLRTAVYWLLAKHTSGRKPTFWLGTVRCCCHPPVSHWIHGATLIVCGRLPSTEYLKVKGVHHLPLRVSCWGNGTVPILKLQLAKRDYGIGTILDCARKRRYPEYSWISSIVDAPIVVITVTLRGSCNGKGVCSIRVRPN